MENRTGARLPAEAFRIRKRVFDTLTREQMIPEGSTVFAGLSGGADSVCLLRMLAAYREMHPFSLTAVHIHHGIRGEEAEEDARFCEALARELQLPAWYGRNLDALFDMLTSLPGQWILRLAHPQALDVLGDYGRAFAETLQDAALENPHLQIHWIP